MDYTKRHSTYKPSLNRSLALQNADYPTINIPETLSALFPRQIRTIQTTYNRRRSKYLEYREKIQSGSTPSTERGEARLMRSTILRRDNFHCQNPNCENLANIGSERFNTHLHIHHIKPLSEGGLSVPENMVTLCAECHLNTNPEWLTKLNEKQMDGLQDTIKTSQWRYSIEMENK